MPQRPHPEAAVSFTIPAAQVEAIRLTDYAEPSQGLTIHMHGYRIHLDPTHSVIVTDHVVKVERLPERLPEG